MAENGKYEEAARFLGRPKEQIEELVEKGEITAYQVGGVYLRFKQGNLQEFKDSIKRSGRRPALYAGAKKQQHAVSFMPDNIKDFFYFNDFYILAVFVIAALIFIILRNIG